MPGYQWRKWRKRTGAIQLNIRICLNRLSELGNTRLKGLVDSTVFGYGISLAIYLTIDEGFENSIMKTLSEMNPVCYLATGQNSDELSIEARFRDRESMDHFLKKELSAIKGLRIKGYAMVVPRIVQNIDSWLPSREIFQS